MKQHVLKLFTWALLLIPSFILAEVVELDNMSKLPSHLTPATLVIFDIDNTIMEPAQQLGSDQWFHHRIQHYKATGEDNGPALEKALSEWMAVQCITNMQLVEPETADLIKDLQKKGYMVMGLTTRGLGLAMRTLQQLTSLDVDLGKTSPRPWELLFDNGKSCLYREGILFTAGSHKGKALDRLLKSLKLSPKRILFVNDKQSHIEPIAGFCEEKEIDFIGLRYSFLDEKVRNLNADVVQVQFEKFRGILSDEDAQREVKALSLLTQ